MWLRRIAQDLGVGRGNGDPPGGTTPKPMTAVEGIDAEMRRIYGNRAWLVASDVLQGAGHTVRRLRGWGAPPCFAIGAREGVGDLPADGDWERHVLGLPGAPMMEAIQQAEDAFRNLPPHIVAAVEAFDPQRQIRVIGAIFSDGRDVAHRRFWGARPKAWRDLEDKVVIDQLWDRCGITRVPSRIVRVDRSELLEAHRALDRGLGTVWSGDASRGFHGGATFTFPVTNDGDAARALHDLEERCVRARVMPFLDGIPCSIHGIVFPSHVLVLRPAELLVLRDVAAGRFRYCRAATFWDPSNAVRQEMRNVARVVGETLRLTLGYAGAFTVDGVATAEGFRPTELNPRVGAALGLLVPEFPFSFLHDALVEGVPIDTDPEALERELVDRADASRRASVGFLVDEPLPDTLRSSVAFDGTTWREVPADEAHGQLSIGPGATGGYVALQVEHGAAPVGPSFAPRVAALATFLEQHHGLQVGALSPARPSP
jgi:hypothetical protein